MPRWMLLGTALLLGAGLSVQAGINAQLRVFWGNPFRSALTSVFVSALALGIIALATGGNPPALRQTAWWMWTGGLLGAAFVAGSIILAPRLGAAPLSAALVVGQLLAAVMIDHFGLIGYPVVRISPVRVVGALLLLAGIALLQR